MGPTDWSRQAVRTTGGRSPAGRQMLDPLPDSLHWDLQKRTPRKDETSPTEVLTPLRQSRRRKKDNAAKIMKQASDNSEEHNKVSSLLQRLMLGGDTTPRTNECMTADKRQQEIREANIEVASI